MLGAYRTKRIWRMSYGWETCLTIGKRKSVWMKLYLEERKWDASRSFHSKCKSMCGFYRRKDFEEKLLETDCGVET